MHGSLLGPEERPGFTPTGAGSMTRPSAAERRAYALNCRDLSPNVGRGAERAPLGWTPAAEKGQGGGQPSRPRGRRRARFHAEC
jgi:hypothetical protein